MTAAEAFVSSVGIGVLTVSERERGDILNM